MLTSLFKRAKSINVTIILHILVLIILYYFFSNSSSNIAFEKKDTDIAKKQSKIKEQIQNSQPQSNKSKNTPSYKSPLHTQSHKKPEKKTTHTSNAKTDQTKAAISTAQLTAGFIDHMNMKEENKKKMVPNNEHGTTELLIQQRYVGKLRTCLQNSFAIHKKELFTIAGNLNFTAEIYIGLHRNGQIKELELVQSSGNPQLDRFALFLFQDASSAFPPIPQSIAQEPYQMIYPVQVREFMGQYYWQ